MRDFVLAAWHWYQANSEWISIVFAAVIAAYHFAVKMHSVTKGVASLFLDLQKRAADGEFGENAPGKTLMDKAVAYFMDKLAPKLPVVLRPLASEVNVRLFLQWCYDVLRFGAKEIADQPVQPPTPVAPIAPVVAPAPAPVASPTETPASVAPITPAPNPSPAPVQASPNQEG